MEIDYVSIGIKIRELRKKHKWTQDNLAEVAMVEPSNISHIERGATKVSLPTLVRLANALGSSLDEIVYGSIIVNDHISNKKINELLEDMSASELMAMVEIISHAKGVLRKYSGK